jgi:hypothetical protein
MLEKNRSSSTLRRNAIHGKQAGSEGILAPEGLKLEA